MKHLSRLILLLLLAGPARAAPPAEADKLIERGIDLREQGKDQEALELFEKAWELGKSPRALAQIGLAQQALGRWLEAEAKLQSALADAKHPWIKARRAALESALAKVRERVGRVEVLGTPGAQVTIDGKVAGTLPLAAPIPAVAGTVNVEVRAEGYLPVTRAVVVPAGGLARETIELAARPTAPEPPKVVEAPPAPKASPPVAVRTAAPPSSGGTLSTVGYVTGGAALVAAGVGTAFLFVRNSHVSAYNDDSVCLAGGRTRDENCGDELDAADSAGVIMIASYIGAAALAGTTALLFVLDEGEPSAQVALRCAPALDHPGVLCGGRF